MALVLATTTVTEPNIRVSRDIKLCCRIDGDGDGPALVLIAGLGQQLIEWPQVFVEGLLAAGLRVVRFDNRDIGRSSRASVPAPTAIQMLTKRFSAGQYTLGDMAFDVVALLDRLELDAAHVVGMSMGGMIGQTLAARHPSRVLTLTSIMSTTGARRVGKPTLGAYYHLFRPVSRQREVAAGQTVAAMRYIGSPGFPFDESHVRALALEGWDRDGGPNPDGPARQLGAIFKSGDRTPELRAISAPTLVIHGDGDRLVRPSGGVATARAITGARLLKVPGMGHDLPAAACPQLVAAITEHVGAANATVGDAGSAAPR